MNKSIKIIFLLIFSLFILSSYAQKDTSDMRFDFGWTRDKDLNLWPLLKYKKDTSIGFVKTDILFSLYQYRRNRELDEKYSHFFPIWQKKSNIYENDFRLFSLYYPSVFHSNKDDSTNIKSFDFLEIAPGISALGFSKSKDGLYIENNLLFLLWFNKNDVKKSSYLVFFPVYWSFKNPRLTTSTFFPLWSTGYYKNNGFKYTAITPLFWHFRRDNKSGNVLFPIYWNSKDKDSINPLKTNVIFPLWYSYSDRYRKNQILFPLAYRFKKPDNQSFTLLPLYSLSKDTSGTKKFLMVTPLYWHIDFYNEKTRAFLPFWVSYTDEYRKNRVLLPFIYYQKNRSYRSFTFLPLFSYGADSTKKRNHFAITPVFWHFKERERIVNTVFPVFWDTKYFSETSPKHRTVLFPLFFKFHDNYRKRFTVFPVLYVFHNDDYSSFTLLPLVSYGRSADSTRKHLSLATVYWQYRQKDDTLHILFPLWWNRDRVKWDGKHYYNVIFPLYWSFKNPEHINKVFFPFTWSLRDPYYHSFTFIPLFSYGHSPSRDQKHFMISPLFWRIKNEYTNTTALFPILWHTKCEGEMPFRRSIVLPFWWSYRDSLKRNSVLFPFVWRFKNTDYTSTTIFPLLSAGKSNDGYQKYRVVTPLFWSFKKGQNQRTTLFPVFDSKTSENGDRNFGILYFLFRYKKEDSLKRTDFIWPICQYKSGPDLKYFRLAPVIWYKKTTELQFFSFQPLYYQYKNAEFADYHLLWQLFTYKNTYGREKSWNLLWKVLYYEKYQPKGHEFRFLYLVFADVKRDSLVEKSFFPLYYYSKESNGSRSFSLFFYFYNSLRRKLPNSFEFYKEERIFWFIRFRSNYRRLKAEGKI